MAAASRAMSGSWFGALFGFEESVGSHAAFLATQRRFRQDGTTLVSLVNGARFEAGTFEAPTLAELRARGTGVLHNAGRPAQRVTVSHIAVDDAMKEHARHPGATFQAASQFNALEFIGPSVTPEDGVTGYAEDGTQGPACALACAAGTVVRNYLIDVAALSVPPSRGSSVEPTAAAAAAAESSTEAVGVGQRADRQLDLLDALGDALDNGGQRYWRVRNGYVSTESPEALQRLDAALGQRDEGARATALLGLVRVGIQRDTGVTFTSRWARPASPVTVTQVYCSALSLGAYTSGAAAAAWERFARFVLDATYESTLWAAVETEARTGVRDVFLTFVGGGVFGNQPAWIAAAIGRAVGVLTRAGAGLHVHVCHFRSIDETRRALVDASVRDYTPALPTP